MCLLRESQGEDRLVILLHENEPSKRVQYIIDITLIHPHASGLTPIALIKFDEPIARASRGIRLYGVDIGLVSLVLRQVNIELPRIRRIVQVQVNGLEVATS